MSAIDDIAAERKRQIENEEWSAEHDNSHDRSEMARAAACYALPKSFRDFNADRPGIGSVLDLLWPWDREWWKPKNRRRDLVRAGALIVAEIERLDRQSSAKAA